MKTTYNPPPNWPRPPDGWQPGPGWRPDPAWGPPPSGWQVWVQEPSSDPRPTPTKRRFAVYPFLVLMVGLGVVLLAVAMGGVVDMVRIGPEGLQVDIENSVSGGDVDADEAEQAQPELEQRVDELEQAARAQASPAEPTDADVSGSWLGSNGFTYVFDQYGTAVVLREESAWYGITATGTGSVDGDVVEVEFQAVNTTTGFGELRLEGDMLVGTLTNRQVGTPTPIAMTRSGS